MLATTLPLLSLFVVTVVAQDDHYYHQVVPAARFERYTFSNKNTRAVRPNNFSIQYQNSSSARVNNFLERARDRYMSFWFMDVPQIQEAFSNATITTTLLEPLLALEVHASTNHVELKQGMDESYSLVIPTSGNAVLSCHTIFGALRGLETFGQMLNYSFQHDNGTNVFAVSHTPIFIKDEPAYPHRGLLIDTARHYLPLQLILKTLDSMAMNKMNVLHWHMTDDQSFPYLSTKFPELAHKGSYHAGRAVYTPKDIRHVIQEGYFRGIRVIPEFDMPGHTQAVAKSHAELMSRCPDKPSSPLNPTISKVYDFVKALYDEIQGLFQDHFIHVGGDEVNLTCWELDDRIQSWMKEHNVRNETQLYEYFEQRLLNIVINNNNSTTTRKIVVWQEVFNLGLLSSKRDKDRVIVDVWKGYDDDTIQQATQASFPVLISGCWYLDHLDKNLYDFYHCLPRNFTGSLEQKRLVIGGHASMWGERVDATNFESRVWPRASATAERLWSGDFILQGDNDDILERRMARFRCRMVARNIRASPVGPGYCNVEPTNYKRNKQKETLIVVSTASDTDSE